MTVCYNKYEQGTSLTFSVQTTPSKLEPDSCKNQKLIVISTNKVTFNYHTIPLQGAVQAAIPSNHTLFVTYLHYVEMAKHALELFSPPRSPAF